MTFSSEADLGHKVSDHGGGDILFLVLILECRIPFGTKARFSQT